MKGIILAAGSGTRLSPATVPISKILLPIYDRPMIYYPLSTLLMMLIKEILVITNVKDLDNFKRTLGDGSQYGIKIDYATQFVQRGISDALIIAEEWIGDDEVVLILGDNVLYGSEKLKSILLKSFDNRTDAVIFGYRVNDPRRYGVIEFDKNCVVKSLEEKPENPKSDCASIGLYYYKRNASKYAKKLKPSARGELEITDLNNQYLENNNLSVVVLDDDNKWFDAGTFDSMLDTSLFISLKEKSLKRKIMCPELISYRNHFITKQQVVDWIEANKDSDYYRSILKEIEES